MRQKLLSEVAGVLSSSCSLWLSAVRLVACSSTDEANESETTEAASRIAEIASRTGSELFEQSIELNRLASMLDADNVHWDRLNVASGVVSNFEALANQFSTIWIAALLENQLSQKGGIDFGQALGRLEESCERLNSLVSESSQSLLETIIAAEVVLLADAEGLSKEEAAKKHREKWCD